MTTTWPKNPPTLCEGGRDHVWESNPTPARTVRLENGLEVTVYERGCECCGLVQPHRYVWVCGCCNGAPVEPYAMMREIHSLRNTE